MLTALQALEEIDWSRLRHAYGRATDTPDHLRAFLQEDTEVRQKAVEHLWSAVFHQGTPWTATAPVALVVAELVCDPRIDQGPEPVRADLLSFLVAVTEAAEESPLSIQELEGLASHTLVKTEGLRNQAKDIESRLLALAQSAQDTDERSAHVLSLGDLGFAPVAFLKDSSPAVPMCAALAPGLARNAAAIAELLNALKCHAGGIDDCFKDRPRQFTTRPRFAAVTRLVEQVVDFEQLVDAAVAVAAITSKHCVDFDWGPLLAAAFPDGRGIIETKAQCRFLGALVDNAELWDWTFADPLQWFRKAGLPYHREPCAKLIEEARCRNLQ